MENPYLDQWRKHMGLEDDALLDEWIGCSWLKRFEIEQKLGQREMFPGGPKLPPMSLGFMAREGFVKKFAWSIPTEEAVRKIVEFSPIIDLGAGTGYWAWCVEQLGGSVIALDAQPKGNSYHNGHLWTEVLEGRPEALRRYRSKYSLFLSWPSYATPFAYEALQRFRGDTLIYIGEGSGGCTGCDAFHDLLEEEWTQVDLVEIPQYSGIHDRMFIYQRNKTRSRHWTYYKRVNLPEEHESNDE